MSVNGIKLAAGQKWKTKNYGVVTLSEGGVSSNYPWRMNFPNNGDPIGSITTDGKYWEEDEMPELLECIYNPEDKEEKKPMKFNPQPGDKIICNNGDELICCSADFLVKDGFDVSIDSNLIYGYQPSKHGLYQYGWTFWNESGVHGDEGWCIREVVPQSAEGSADKKEEVKEEPRYSLQEIKEAWDASGWVISTSAWEVFQKNLTKINSPQYQEYLRLKAIYE